MDSNDLNIQEVISFGNDDNDLVMLKKSRYGIAVKESSKVAIDAADIHLDIGLGDFLIGL
ncbi:HAD hydrolase family protein [Seinonella peptonophila]|uniref:HAD hydrolase family protein n=1 Tax=Seinonella peptonophila TaxID=112248 RepID=UPI000932C606